MRGIFHPGIKIEDASQGLTKFGSEVRGKDGAHAMSEHVKARAGMPPANFGDNRVAIFHEARVLINMSRRTLGMPKASMIASIDGQTALRQCITHIDKPAGMCAQTVQDEQNIPAIRYPTAQEEFAAISHRQRFGSYFDRVGSPHLSPIALSFLLVEHNNPPVDNLPR